MLAVSPSDTHCCWFGGIRGDCSILPSCHRCRPVTRRVGGCGRCLGNSSEVASPWGRGCLGPADLSAGSAAWWSTGLQGREGPGPALSEPPSQTACSSLWTGCETLSEGLPHCLAVREQEFMFQLYKHSKNSHAVTVKHIICQQFFWGSFMFTAYNTN